ncbi:1,4-alpha-glucan branching protein [Streptomyces durbertensis]|uniref:1,4-alpha-glucan branching protein n=1 Tax=Streptomyces durbertensis TaxID=2448886 RepID=A0ABR6EL72_9ACTN|nr:1,4-alpha-glucan branching protein [Streptomyces durbertensis]MBB1246081.1 1,4-alpha-glucan branching protein [Streptomyces durbertensis]
MATVHRTTMSPTKLELLAGWLPKQSWYEGARAPELAVAGGFRLDDPAGEVGIEVMIVADASARETAAYLVPLGYRGEPLEDAPAEALIGTSEHGVLGTRWIYDGTHDPVVMTRLRALLRGEATPQHQNESDTPDPSVTVHGACPDDGFEVRVRRVLRSMEDGGELSGVVVAAWTRVDGTATRGVVAVAESR